MIHCSKTFNYLFLTQHINCHLFPVLYKRISVPSYAIYVFLWFRSINSLKTLIVCTMELNFVSKNCKAVSAFRNILFYQTFFLRWCTAIGFLFCHFRYWIYRTNNKMEEYRSIVSMYKKILCHTYRLIMNSSFNSWPKF